MNGSLQARLAWRLALVFAAVILATSAALYIHRGRGDAEAAAYLLHRTIGRVAAALSRGPDGAPRLALGDLDGRFDYAVAGSDGRVLFASKNPPPGPGPMPGWPEGYLRRPETTGDDIVAFTQVDTAIGPVEIRVGLEGSEALRLESFERELGSELLPILLPTLAGALAIGALTLRGGLKPLQGLAGEVARITPAQSERRLRVAGLPRELVPLVRAINAALDRLDEGFRAQRDFTADAAHQLRTPLAILAAHLDTLGDRATAAFLREDVARMSRLVEQLLLVSELEALTLEPGERADLSAIAVEVAEALGPLALARRRDIAVLGAEAPVIVHGNRDALHQALRNLAENGLTHTAEATAVEIAIGAAPPRIAVRDHGPGIAAADRDKLFKRFWRADRSNSRGAGLGLAIVKRIAAAHGAEVAVADAPGGGACFVVSFPPAPPGREAAARPAPAAGLVRPTPA
jgi:signal transduction histidine kinase